MELLPVGSRALKWRQLIEITPNAKQKQGSLHKRPMVYSNVFIYNGQIGPVLKYQRKA